MKSEKFIKGSLKHVIACISQEIKFNPEMKNIESFEVSIRLISKMDSVSNQHRRYYEYTNEEHQKRTTKYPITLNKV